MLQTGGSVQNLKTEIEAYRGVLLELQVAVVAIARHAIVEARIEEDLRRDEAVELEDEGVFPFQLHTLVGSVAIEARARQVRSSISVHERSTVNSEPKSLSTLRLSSMPRREERERTRVYFML